MKWPFWFGHYSKRFPVLEIYHAPAKMHGHNSQGSYFLSYSFCYTYIKKSLRK